MKLISAVALVLVLFVAGCSAPATLASIEITPSTATADVGATVQFIETGVYAQVTWSSSEVSVATINSVGLATAIGSGTTSIIILRPCQRNCEPDGPVAPSRAARATAFQGGMAAFDSTWRSTNRRTATR